MRIIWVDDAFFPPDNLTQDIKVNRNRNNVPNIGKVWIDNFLDNYQDDDPDDLPDRLPVQGKWLLANKNACEPKSFAFAVTSFEFCDEHIDDLNTEDTLFLIDVQNLNASGNNQDKELYGYKFVKNNKIPKERIRYYTRHPNSIGQARKLYFPDISDEDYIIPSVDTEKIEQWLDSHSNIELLPALFILCEGYLIIHAQFLLDLEVISQDYEEIASALERRQWKRNFVQENGESWGLMNLGSKMEEVKKTRWWLTVLGDKEKLSSSLTEEWQIVDRNSDSLPKDLELLINMIAYQDEIQYPKIVCKAYEAIAQKLEGMNKQ